MVPAVQPGEFHGLIGQAIWALDALQLPIETVRVQIMHFEHPKAGASNSRNLSALQAVGSKLLQRRAKICAC